jgi:hypothetical protein
MSTAQQISEASWLDAIRATADTDGWTTPGVVAESLGVGPRAAGYWVRRRLITAGLVEVRRESPRGWRTWWRVR